MKTIRFSLIAASLLIFSKVFGQSPEITARVAMISGDSLFSKIAVLQEMDRYRETTDPTCLDYLYNRLSACSFDSIHLQYFNPLWQPNIIALKTGTLYPDSFIIVGAHYDACMPYAPGADDNASGTAGILEISSALGDCQFEKTVCLVLFSGEEAGMIGSAAFADSMVLQGKDVQAMINMDMISFSYFPSMPDVSLCFKALAVNLKDEFTLISQMYVTGLILIPDSTSDAIMYSDHASFWAKDIPALLLINESDMYSPYFNFNIHTDSDTLWRSANCPQLAEMITQSTLAWIMETAGSDCNSTIIRPAVTDQMIQVSPNPVYDVLSVLGRNKTIGKVSLYNTQGILKGEWILNSEEGKISLGNQPSGLYLLRIEQDGMIQIVRIVKE